MKLTKEQFISKTKAEAEKIGIFLNLEQMELIYEYKCLLIEWNDNINLTAITDDEEIIVKHVIDSLSVVKYIKEEEKVIDIGTGAGLPGIIIAIYFQGKVNVTLLDSLNKRVVFLNEVIERLKLKNTVAIHGRAEELGVSNKYREKYDVVLSRAVAVLNVLLEITVPFAKVNGKCVYMKSEKTFEEIENAKNAIKELNVNLESVDKYNLKLNEEIYTHTIVFFLKLNKNLEKYPRQFSKIKKNPL